MRDHTVVVFDDIVNRLGGICVEGRIFLELRDAFQTPYRSSQFFIYVGSQLSQDSSKWPISDIAG